MNDAPRPTTGSFAATPGGILGLESLRASLSTVQREAEEEGRVQLSEAFRRIGLLIELWECLDGEQPGLGAEISTFCTQALEQLARMTSPREGADARARILRESNQRWGEYLALIDPDSSAETDWVQTLPDEIPVISDTPATIDPGVLFRMLTGNARPPEILETGWTPSPNIAAELLEPPPSRAPSPSDLLEVKDVPLTGDWSLAADAGDFWGGTESSIPESIPTWKAFEIPPPPSHLSMDAELCEIFLSEASDLFERIETLVLSLGRGQGEGEGETLHELARCFHTLKGAAGSVGIGQLAAVVHGMEEQLETTPGAAGEGLVTQLHQLLHYLEGTFDALKQGGPPPPSTFETTVPLPSGPVSHHPSEPGPASSPSPDKRSGNHAPPMAISPPPARDNPEGGQGEGPVRVSAERVDELMDLVSELITRRGLWSAQAEAMNELSTMARVCRTRLNASIDRLRDLTPTHVNPSARVAASGDRFDRSEDLPELIRRLGEQSDDLVVLVEAAQAAAKPLADNSDGLARITLQLWEALQAIRIVPVRGLFQRLSRVAHDAARIEGRHVEVAMLGEETGLDRAVQDKAFEPLLHVVRNAVSHGIESADERVKAGKPAMGRVTLSAERSGNTLILAVQDDGKGLDYEAIAAKGRRLGLIGPDDAPTLERLNALIFQSGFSTRDEANSIAGRGVGMDVVAQEVARMHGSVVLESKRGSGTRLSVSLPSRLALQRSIVVRVDGQAYALPVDVIDLVQPYDQEAVSTTQGAAFIKIREDRVPLVDARMTLGTTPSSVSCPKLLLIRSEGGSVALKVDAIDGTSELVVKPLGTLLAGHPLVSGMSLSVTGEVIFALNPAGLARSYAPEGAMARETSGVLIPPRAAPILVVDDSISVRKVVARHLRALGHEVEEVSDGLEALGKIRLHTYGLVLSDLEMPRMDGFELLAELNRLEIAKSIPVVIASTKSDLETRRRAISLGAREFIAKPIEPEVMAAKVQELLRVRETDERARSRDRDAASLAGMTLGEPK